MAGLDETPKGGRVHIAFFGLRNAGKSTLVNAFTGQNLAIVSDVAGTTTDPVSKAMEILPLGPCLITDTAGLDDAGELGAMRVGKSLDVLATADIAVWVSCGGGAEGGDAAEAAEALFRETCAKRGVAVLEYRRGDSVEELKERIAAVKLAEVPRGLLDGMVAKGDRIVCVCPIDGSAPKGRLILPQVQLVRECLDAGAWCAVCQPAELPAVLACGAWKWVVTDSQAFGEVSATLERVCGGGAGRPERPRLTSFSILFARQKGDLDEYAKGVEAIGSLRDGDTVLIAEGCTHRRQCNDIGTVKLPKALRRLTGRDLRFVFASGNGFEIPAGAKLAVQCGGCMLTRRETLRRIEAAREAGVPIANYGMVLAAASGIRVLPGSVEAVLAPAEGRGRGTDA